MQLNEHTRQMFLTLRETKYGFEGLTNNKPALQRRMDNVIIERPTVEEIMLGYVRR
jgi:ABC-2 type transport system ATP-binding protein